MSLNLAQHENLNKGNGRGRSGLFAGLPFEQIQMGLNQGVAVFEDFHEPSGTASSPVQGFDYTADAASLPTDNEGIIQIDTSSVSGNEAFIASQGFTDMNFAAADSAAAMECRVQVNDVANFSLLAGFVARTVAPTALLSAAGALATSNNFFGLFSSSANSDLNVYPVYVKNASTAVTMTSTGVAVAATTWIKLGFKIVNDPDGTRLEFYVNGSRKNNVTKKAVSDIDGFSAGKFFVMVQTLTTADRTLKVDFMSHCSTQ